MSIHRRNSLRWLATAIAVAVSLVAPVHRASAVEQVVTTSNFEFAPSGDEVYVAYVANSEDHPRRYNTFLGVGGIRLNPPHTRGGTPSIDAGNDTVAFAYGDEGQWVIRFYDIFFDQYVSVPDFVNTRLAEQEPSLSEQWLLLTRTSGSRSRVMLFDLTSGERRVLAIAPPFRARSEQVNGEFAVYTDGRNEYLYDIAADTSVRFPNRGRSGAYGAGSVTSDGTAYAAHVTGDPCSGAGEIRRLDPDGTLTAIYEFARGRYVTSKTAAVETADGTSILFDRFNCRTGDSNIYRLDAADSAISPTRATSPL